MALVVDECMPECNSGSRKINLIGMDSQDTGAQEFDSGAHSLLCDAD